MILIVEDDILLREGIAFALQKEGYLVSEAGSVSEAEKKLNQGIHLIILDLNLPDRNGGDFLADLRKVSELPVIVLTAKDLEEDVVKTFQLGCDDYMTKPFSTAILLSHVKAVLKRAGNQDKDIYCCGNLTYHFAKKELKKDGNRISLTATEYRLLELFLQNRNQVLTRELILERVWDTYENFVEEKTLSVNIRRLREKVENNVKHPEHILTVFGIGYKWSDSYD